MSQSKKECLKRGKLFIPLIYSLGATLEDFSVDSFLNDPTKISNSLRVMQNHFKVDGVFCCGKDTVLLEDLGGPDFFGKRLSSPSALKEMLDHIDAHAGKIAGGGKSAVALEVTRRLNILMPDTVIVSVMAGPVKLASQLFGLSSGEVLENPEILASTTKVTLSFARGLGEAGIDILLIRENKWPFITSRWSQVLFRCYSPMVNTAEYYGYNALLMPDELSGNNVAPFKKIFDRIIFPASTHPVTSTKNSEQSFSLPTRLLERPPKDIESYFSQNGILGALKSSRLFMMTTDQEIFPAQNRDVTIEGIATIRDILKKKF
jgi:hypothetical protein